SVFERPGPASVAQKASGGASKTLMGCLSGYCDVPPWRAFNSASTSASAASQSDSSLPGANPRLSARRYAASAIIALLTPSSTDTATMALVAVLGTRGVVGAADFARGRGVLVAGVAAGAAGFSVGGSVGRRVAIRSSLGCKNSRFTSGV